MEDFNDLNGRLKKLESAKDGGVKFFIQYLLSPLLVVLVGLIFNWQIESSKKEVQQLQLAYSMLNTLFADDEIKTLATKRLMDEVITRDDLKKAIGVMVDDYLSKKFRTSVSKGDIEQAKQIADAADLIGGKSGDAISKIIQSNPTNSNAIAKYDNARYLELKGFKAILSGNVREAISCFERVQFVYPRFHSVDEILQLLKRNEAQFSQQDVRGKVFNEIAANYSWKLPPDLVNRLKEKAKEQ